jgi:hypothetical protein
MKYTQNLNEFDILDLLNEYHSELRKLEYKAEFVKGKIEELENLYFTLKSSKLSSNTELQKNERLTKNDEITSVNAESGDASQDGNIVNKSRKPYPLSRYDQIIMQCIEENGRATLSKDIFEKTKEKAIEEGIFESEEKAKSKINQCLVKLTNRRGDIKKVNHKGRGFAYALPEWFDERGKIIKGRGIKLGL